MSTPFPSQMTGAQIENALNKVNGLIAAVNNGKILCVDNGSLAAKSAIEIQGGTIDSLNITANGTYNHAALGGYSPVVVNVPTSGVMTQLSVTANGVYTPSAGVDGFNSVNVNVPAGSVNAMAIIRAHYPAGSICTATKGSYTFNSNANGEFLFCLPESGTWNLTCGSYISQVTLNNYQMKQAYLGIDQLKQRCAMTSYARLSNTIGDSVLCGGRGFEKTSNSLYLLFFAYSSPWGGYGIAAYTQSNEFTRIDVNGGIDWVAEYTPEGGKRIYIGKLPGMWSGQSTFTYTSGSVSETISRPPYYNHGTNIFEGDNATDLIDIVRDFSNLQ